MQFSDTTYKQGIIEDITFLTGVDTNKYAIGDRTRNVNEWNRKVWTWAFESYGGWQYDDDNLSDASTLPAGTVTLVSGTSTYGLPSGTLTVRKVEVLQSDGSTWISLSPLPLEMIGQAEQEFLKTSSTPRFYRLVGDVIKLYPAPNYSGTNYLKVFFDRDISAFATTDTTKVPGFAAPFHRILSIGSSLDYCIANDIENKVVYLTNLAVDYERRIKRFYAKRFVANFPAKMVVRDSVRQYI